MWHTGERSNLSSDICQWLRAPSVNNQSQNAPSVIPRILLVCLPGNRLGNQHGNHIWDPVLYLWMIACPHLINCILPGVYYQFKIILKSAFNKQAHHKVLYGVTEGINAEEKLSKRRTKVIWLSLYYFWQGGCWTIFFLELDSYGEDKTTRRSGHLIFFLKTQHKFWNGNLVVTRNNKNYFVKKRASLIVT